MKNIYLWTGNGWGKTTSALGVALRAIGHKKKVIIIQFMKGRKYIGEYKINKKLKPYYNIYQFGRKSFVNLKKPSEKDKLLAKKGFEFVDEAVKMKPFLLILDEINLACAIKLLNVNDVIEKLKKIPNKITIYLTGRYAPKRLIKLADFVTEIKAVRHPRTYKTRKGIDY